MLNAKGPKYFVPPFSYRLNSKIIVVQVPIVFCHQEIQSQMVGKNSQRIIRNAISSTMVGVRLHLNTFIKDALL